MEEKKEREKEKVALLSFFGLNRFLANVFFFDFFFLFSFFFLLGKGNDFFFSAGFSASGAAK